MDRRRTIRVLIVSGLLMAWCATVVVLVNGVDVHATATQLNPYKRIELMAHVLGIITKNYVDEVDPAKLLDGAIDGMLGQLDPHSTYVPAEELQRVTDQLTGNYEGVGIYYDIRDGILTVISPLEGSPSDQLGIRAGDEILKIDGESAIGIKSEEVQMKLRGPRGTTVAVSIRRAGQPELLDFVIVRDRVLIQSVPYSFMIRPGVGYVRIVQFSSTTADELERALRELKAQGMKRLLLDLRGNGGGLLDHAVRVAGMFIQRGKRIVYTRGQIPDANVDYVSSREPLYPDIPLIVMISHGSASASEIVSGAIQDWDRGLVVGQTSFGKGLVQQRFPPTGTLENGAAVLLTIARWYTPSGRLIQRPYGSDRASYVEDAFDDVDPNADSDSTAQKPIFHTAAGRKVYGGGGITPDSTLIPTQLTPLELRLLKENSFFDFATRYAGEHGDLPKDFERFLATFEVGDDDLARFEAFVRESGVEIDDVARKESASHVRLRIKQEIAGILWGWREKALIALGRDSEVDQAIALFDKAERLARTP